MGGAEAVEQAVALGELEDVLAALEDWRGSSLSEEERAAVRLDLARVLLERGQKRGALDVARVALAAARAMGADAHETASILDLLAPLELELGDARRALELSQEALEVAHATEGEAPALLMVRAKLVREAANVVGDAFAESEAVARINALGTEISAFGGRLRSPALRVGVGDGIDGDQDCQLVAVHFSTHRSRTGSENPYDFYSTARGEASFGKAVVSVPKNREVGMLARPPRSAESNFDETRFDPSRHFIIKTISIIDDRAVFLEDIDYAAETSEHGEAFVFVHGYNTTFAGGLLRTAQLAVDLEISGAAVLYSWPSRGSLLSYFVDRNQLIGPHIQTLREVIIGVAAQPHVKRVHLVAHSLGCKFMMEALLKLAAEREQVRLDEMVFASPDVDVEDFNHAVRELASLPGRITVYTSAFDAALLASGMLQSGMQAGRNPARLAASGIVAIDTSAVKNGVLGHGDFANSAIDDLKAVIWIETDIGPDERAFVLVPEDGPYGRYWRFEPEKPIAEDGPFRESLVWARRLGLAGAAQTLANSIKVWGGDARRKRERARAAQLLELVNAYART